MIRVILISLLISGVFADSRFDDYLFSDDYTTVRRGISLGGDMNVRKRGMTPLYNASRRNWGDIMELMIARGADIDAKSYGETPLLKVVGKKVNDVSLAKILIANDADVNVQDNHLGNTPLFYAILNKNNAMIKLLLDNGADMYVQNKKGDTPARYILSTKIMPAVLFSNNDITISAGSFKMGQSVAKISVKNKTKKFLSITQVAVYINDDLVGEAKLEKNVPPSSSASNIASIKIPSKVYKTIKIKSNGSATITYGLAVEYTLDGSSSSFEDSKEINLQLW